METYNHAPDNTKEFFPSEFARVLGRQAVRLIQNGHIANNENLSLAPEFRADLESFNDHESRKDADRDSLNQNVIFTHFVKNSGEKGREILHLISPKEKYLKLSDQQLNEFASHYDLYEGTESYYDFISALTAKDESGNYQVSDENLNQFTDWYLSEVHSLENTFNEHAPEIEKYYSGAMKRAVKNGYLPDICNVLVERLDTNPSLRQDIEYTLSDRTNVKAGIGVSPSGSTRKLKNTDKFIISVAIDQFYLHPTQSPAEAKQAFYVINHEITHALEELRPLSFKNNGSGLFSDTPEDVSKSANRIFKEAITEDIGGIISNIHDNAAPDSIKPFCENGRSYRDERETLRFLQSGGNAEISPDLFYEAYVDSGTSWSKLKKELKASFPECETDSKLADFIVQKFNNIKEENS